MTEWIPANAIPELTKTASANPYAAPISDPALPQTTLVEGELPHSPIPLEIGFCISQGWKHTFASYGTIFLTGLVYFGVMFVFGIISSLINGTEGSEFVFNEQTGEFRSPQSGYSALTGIFSIAEQILTLFLSMGATKIALDILAGQQANVGDLFSQGSKLLSGIGASILFGLMVVVGLILLIIPGIIVAVRFGYYQQAIVEKNLGPIEALKYSWRLTQDNGLMVFCLGLLNILIVIAGVITLVFGLLIAIPVVWLASHAAYRFLQGGPNRINVLP